MTDSLMIESDEIRARLAAIRHVALDMDGTIYRGGRLFAATLPFLQQLRDLKIGYSFLTNNTSLSRADYVAKLQRLGIDATRSEINTPVDATIAWLRDQAPQARSIAVLGTPSLCAEFEAAGWCVDWDHPEAVVVGFDTGLSYDRLCRAAYWIQQGLPFVATHPDFVCPTDEPTVLVDCGAICACLTAATGRQPVVLGKPEPSMLLELCQRHQLSTDQLAMVGDRLYTDIAMARRSGALSVLVLSGEATRDDVATMNGLPPELVVADIGVLGHHLAAAKTTF